MLLAAVLLAAAARRIGAPPRDLRHNWVPVASLAVGVVLLTTVAVAFVTHALVPGLPWAAAIALGAIVAPAFHRREEELDWVEMSSTPR